MQYSNIKQKQSRTGKNKQKDEKNPNKQQEQHVQMQQHTYFFSKPFLKHNTGSHNMYSKDLNGQKMP